jgi:hypothetical protein
MLKRLGIVGTAVLAAWLLVLSCTEPKASGTADAARSAVASATCLGEGTSRLGGPCPCADDCQAGLICIPESTTGAPQGECMLACVDDKDCPDAEGYFCSKLQADSALGICVKRCQTSDDCGDDRHWCMFDECQTVCARDDQCLSGHCDQGRHFCDDGSLERGSAPLLGACLRDDDCESGSCIGSRGAYCGILCTPDRVSCPTGSACHINGCDPPCQTSADCPKPWICDVPNDDPEGQLLSPTLFPRLILGFFRDAEAVVFRNTAVT